MESNSFIESYEPFHIGSRCQYYVKKTRLVRKIINYYEKKSKSEEEKKYKLDKEIIRTGTATNPIANLVEDLEKGTSIQLNIPVNALNVVGDNPEKVFESFQELFSKLPEFGFELDSTFIFHEIISNVVVKIDKDPKKIFQELTPNNFKNIEGVPQLSINSLNLSDRFIPKVNEEKFEIKILPHETSPKKRIIIRVLMRTERLELIEDYYNKFPLVLNNIYNKFAGVL
jgi:hypothetical protein